MRYFKHIFAGSERIATKPCGEPCRTKGGGIPLVPVEAPPVKDSLVMSTQSLPSPPPVSIRDSLWNTYLSQTANCLGVQRQNLLLDFRINSLEARITPLNENTTYFYHPDHLGSTGYLSTHLQNGHTNLWSIYLNQTANCLGVQRQNLLLDFRINSLEPRFTPLNENTTYFYHPDHLGSTGYLSTHLQNGHARITQHYQYTPYGEAFVHQKYWQNTAQFNHQNPYEFNGKEKDLETGYNHYGAKHYNATWGVWLSVDPLAEKNLHESNYVFSSNNPINRVDPNGMDDYWVDKKGNITLVEGTQNNGQPDRLIAGKPIVHKKTGEYKNNVFTLDTKNGDFGKSIEHDKGTAKIEENGNIIEVDYIGYAFRDVSHNMEGLYNFLQDNTNVEFSLTEYDENGKCGSAIATSRDRRFEAIGSKFATAHSIGGTLRRFTHGHPYADAALDGVGTWVTGKASEPDKELFRDLSDDQAKNSKNGITKPDLLIRYGGVTRAPKF